MDLDAITPVPVLPKPTVKLYANDRVGMFDEEQHLIFGTVAINCYTGDTRIEWDEGKDQNLKMNGNRDVILKHKIGIFDRRSVGFGSKVKRGDKIGHVREKRFLVTLVHEKDVNITVKDVPCEDLVRIGYSRKGDKVVYNDEWLGFIANTRAGVTFKMETNGSVGYMGDDSYGYSFPRVGNKINRMGLYELWDAKWENEADGGWWNFLKNLGNSASIVNTRIDCLSIAWMGSIDNGKLRKIPPEECPPNTLRKREEVDKVYHLFGRNWRYLKEIDNCGYKLKPEDVYIPYNRWARELTDELFFGKKGEYVEIAGAEADDPVPQPSAEEIGTLLHFKVVGWRSIVDVEWDDGSVETLPSGDVEPHRYPIVYEGDKPMSSLYAAGDIILDLKDKKNKAKYGYVVKVFEYTASVKWIIPDPEGHEPKISPLTEVDLENISLHEDYSYLRQLYQLPVLISKVTSSTGVLRSPVNGVRVGVVVGVNIAEGKLIIKCPDKVERLMWAHDFEHFEGDVKLDLRKNKYVPWYTNADDAVPIKTNPELEADKRLRQLPVLSSNVDTGHQENSFLGIEYS